MSHGKDRRPKFLRESDKREVIISHPVLGSSQNQFGGDPPAESFPLQRSVPAQKPTFEIPLESPARVDALIAIEIGSERS